MIARVALSVSLWAMRTRLWWTLPQRGGRTYHRRNRTLRTSILGSLPVAVIVTLAMGNADKLLINVPIIIAPTVLIVMTGTRSWRADRPGDN